MESFLPTNEYKEFEGRVYQNPQLAIDEGNKFIDNLRENQLKQNQQITQQTQNLGTNVPTNLGGLTGANSYFTSRYQVPQTNSAVAELREAAQKAGLQQALNNEMAMWKKRYNDAYRAYQKSAYDKENTPATTPDGGTEGGVDKTDNTNDFVYEDVVPGINGGYTVANIIPDWNNMTAEMTGITGVPYGEDYITNYIYDFPSLVVSNSGSNGGGYSGGASRGVGGVGGR